MGPIQLRLSPLVEFTLPFLRVIDHVHPLLLIGADVLRATTNPFHWSFGGVHLQRGAESVVGFLSFQRPDYAERVPLVWVPQDGQPFRVPGFASQGGGNSRI